MAMTTTRLQTQGPGGTVLQRSSTLVHDHVVRSLDEARHGRRAWIKARDGEPDERLWCVEFRPDPTSQRPLAIVWAWHYEVPFDQPGNPGWITTVRRTLDRLSPDTQEVQHEHHAQEAATR